MAPSFIHLITQTVPPVQQIGHGPHAHWDDLGDGGELSASAGEFQFLI
jgi:hypothetical protein